MAPVKPMGGNPPGTKPGVTGFPQEYNDQPGPSQDLNPDAVTNPELLPPPQRQSSGDAKPARARKGSRKAKQ